MTTLQFSRPPRRVGPTMPAGEMDLQQPPELPEPQPQGLRMLVVLIPGALMTGGMLMMFTGGVGGGGSLLPMALMGAGMIGMMGGQVFLGSGDRKHQAGADRRDYLRFLAQARRRIRQAGEQQRQALAWVHPVPESLWSVAMTSRLWERRPSHPDFGELRMGTGVQHLAVRIASPQTKPVEDLDPVSAKALRRFIKAYSTLADQPIGLYLRGFGQVQLEGDREQVLGLVRALLAQLVVFHGPDEVRLAVCTTAVRREVWDWAKWLPHSRHPTERDPAGPLRLVTESMDEAERLLGPDFTGRGRFEVTAVPTRDEPLVVVVNDGGGLSARHRLAGVGYRNAVLVDLDGIAGQTDLPRLRLAVGGSLIEQLTTDRLGRTVRTPVAVPDVLTLTQMTVLARMMSRYETAAGAVEVRAEDSLIVDRDLPSLLGVDDLAEFDARARWAAQMPAEYLSVPIGTAADGAPLVLDIKESAQGGMGPHGLLIGATGSGKSELLRTLVLAMAMTHSSEALNLVLVDFKGGATFVGLDAMPHTSAVITNLADEAVLVGRMRDAIHGELVRRQELLRAAGNYASRRDYEAARRRGAALDPLPTLFVVVDEFSELISAHPDFIELFVMIGRLGRSLGVHLLLASQRLDEGRISQLEGHLSYRIGLRTFSAMESRSVIGVPDAYELPSAPGNGYLRSDVTTLTRFRAAYVSGPARRRQTRRVRQEVVAAQVVPFGSASVPVAVEPDTPAPTAAPTPAPTPAPQEEPDADRDGVRAVLHVAVDRLVDQGAPAHQVWLPPLGDPPSLDQLLPPLLPHPRRGLGTGLLPGTGPLVVPVGFVDKPFEQSRDLLLVDLSGLGGHVGVAGGPQSGKSTLLRTLICALALTHTPREVQFLCLDFGGGSLSNLSGLPHVGAVTGRLDPDRVTRTVAEVTGLVAERERRFAELGIDGMPAYRAAAAAGQLRPDENTADVFLVVDGWSTIRQEFDSAELQLRPLAAQGLNFGVHLVIATNRWADMHFGMRDQIGTRLELRLGDAVDSVVDARTAASVPRIPGRGLTTGKLHFLAALPRIDGGNDPEDLSEATRDLVEAVARHWHGPAAMPVRSLPAVLPAEQLPEPEGTVRLVIGIEEERLEPVWHDLSEQHLSVLGDTKSGKTNLLRLVLRAITARTTGQTARILVVDWRRQLFDDVPADQLLGYAVSPDSTAAAVEEALAGLRPRMPGATITPEQLRRRDWWSGPDLFVVVDDLEMLVGPDNPLHPLAAMLPHAGDIGLHVVVARAAAGLLRINSDLFMRRLQEQNTPDVALSCPREEGLLLGSTKPRTLPPGRALLCTRRGSRLIQTGYLRPPDHPGGPSTTG